MKIEGSGTIKLTYDTAEEAYSIGNSGNVNGYLPILDLSPILNDFCIEFDAKYINEAVGICIGKTSSSKTGINTTLDRQMMIIRQWVNGSSTVYNEKTLNINSNTYYHHRITLSGTTYTATLTNDDTVVDTATYSINNVFNTNTATDNCIGLWTGWGSKNPQGYIKNIKVTNL